MPDSLLTVDEAAEFLRVHRNTVYALLRSRELPSIRWARSIRFQRADLEAWIEAHTTKAAV